MLLGRGQGCGHFKEGGAGTPAALIASVWKDQALADAAHHELTRDFGRRLPFEYAAGIIDFVTTHLVAGNPSTTLKPLASARRIESTPTSATWRTRPASTTDPTLASLQGATEIPESCRF